MYKNDNHNKSQHLQPTKSIKWFGDLVVPFLRRSVYVCNICTDYYDIPITKHAAKQPENATNEELDANPILANSQVCIGLQVVSFETFQRSSDWDCRDWTEKESPPLRSRFVKSFVYDQVKKINIGPPLALDSPFHISQIIYGKHGCFVSLNYLRAFWSVF